MTGPHATHSYFKLPKLHRPYPEGIVMWISLAGVVIFIMAYQSEIFFHDILMTFDNPHPWMRIVVKSVSILLTLLTIVSLACFSAVCLYRDDARKHHRMKVLATYSLLPLVCVIVADVVLFIYVLP
jgi:hypothetical protein